MPAAFEPNPAGMAAMLRSQSMVEAMREIAGRVETEAVRIAPVRTGHYVNSFGVTAGVRGDVAYARVFNGARSPQHFLYAAALEFGTKYMRKQRILGRALDALNLA